MDASQIVLASMMTTGTALVLVGSRVLFELLPLLWFALGLADFSVWGAIAVAVLRV
jgi:hypothetical protein